MIMLPSTKQKARSLVVLLLLITAVFAAVTVEEKTCPDKLKTLFGPAYPKACQASIFFNIISKFGYPMSVHEVVTKDGYILQTFRIQSNSTNMMQTGKKPIYLQHGLLNSADD